MCCAHSLGVGGVRAAIVKHSNSSLEAVSRSNQNLHIRMILSALIIYDVAQWLELAALMLQVAGSIPPAVKPKPTM